MMHTTAAIQKVKACCITEALVNRFKGRRGQHVRSYFTLGVALHCFMLSNSE